MKYSQIAGMVAWQGGSSLLRKGLSFDDDHPLVTERPDLFTDVKPGADVQTPAMVQGRVQTNMQRPGEVRTERVPVAKAAPRRA